MALELQTEYTLLDAEPADADEVVIIDRDDLTDNAYGTVVRNPRHRLIGATLAAVRSAFTPASASGPASLDLHEDTDNGSSRVRLTAPAALGANRTLTAPDADGTIAITEDFTELATGANGEYLGVASSALDWRTPAQVRADLDLEAGTDFYSIAAANAAFQPLDVDLTALAGLSSADSNFIVGSATGWVVESGATARTSLGVDVAGTDNSTAVTLVGTPDYITLSGQQITRGLIDLTTDVTGDLPVADGGTGASDAATARTNLGALASSAVSAAALTVLDDATVAAMLATMGGAPLASPTFTGTVTVPNDSISYAEIQNVSATDRLLGRDTAAAGDIEELTVTGGLEFTGGPGIQRSALTGDVTATAGSNATTIAAGVVTYAKIQNVAGLSVVARSANSSGVAADVTAGVDGDILRRSGTTLGFGAIPQASVTSLTADLALKAPLASPTFTTALTAANPTFTGTVTIPDGALAIADTSGLQSALDLKAPLASPTFTTALTAANPTFTGTVTIPDNALAIADTSGLQTALDAKLPLAGGTMTGTLTLGSGATIAGGDKVASALEIKDVGETAPAAGSITGSITRSFADGAVQELTLTGNVTALAISNPPASGIAGTITFIINHGSGPFTWSHPTGIKWPAATAPTMSSGASDISIVSYMTRDGGTTWYGFFGGADFS